jgi:hypothetical protein
MYTLGQSRPGRAEGRFGHVRDQPIATVFCDAIKNRDVPISNIAVTAV